MPNILGGERRAEVNLAPPEADSPTIGHGDGSIAEAATGLGLDFLWAIGAHIDLGGVLHADSDEGTPGCRRARTDQSVPAD